MQNNELKYSLAPFKDEEAKLVLPKLQAVLDEFKAELVVSPIINQNGTLGAKVELFKKVELVPKESNLSDGAEPSPETAKV